MLLELQAANAAFAIIKQTIENGASIAKAGKAITDFTNAKDAIDAECRKHGSNIDGSKSDLEVFLAKERIREQEEQLREAMQLFGRGGMYNDYVKHCVEARKARAEAARVAQEEREQLLVYAMYAAIALGIALFVIGVAYLSINK